MEKYVVNSYDTGINYYSTLEDAVNAIESIHENERFSNETFIARIIPHSVKIVLDTDIEIC
jgi:hypothetical protein